MKSKNVSVKTLVEAIKKLETEAYKDFVPGYGKDGKGKSTKNWSMTPDQLAVDFDHSEKTSPERPSVKQKQMSDEEEYIQSLMKVAEEIVSEMDFSSEPTQTLSYDMDDTQEDEPFETTDFVDRAADALAGSLKTNIKKFAGLSPEAMERAVKQELMAVLKDMDATDLYDRS